MKVSSLALALTFCLTAQEAWGQRSYSAEIPVENKDVVSYPKYILDADAGVDDAIAILYFLGDEKQNCNSQVIGITCVNGNTNVTNGVMNVLKTLKVVNRLDIPVYQGCDSPLVKKTQTDAYFGEDGFGDFYYPDPPSRDFVKKKHAVNALISLVKKQPGEITLICMAPLTNIAMAIRMYPKFLRDVKDVYILGGAVEGYGSMRPGVEFNFFVDPEAVYVVFKSAEELGKKLILLPSETFFLRTLIPMDWRLNVLGALKTPAVELINKAENKVLSGEYWLTADPYLAAVALNMSLIKSTARHRMTMETCGDASRGAVFVDYLNKSVNDTVDIIREFDVEMFKTLILKYLG